MQRSSDSDEGPGRGYVLRLAGSMTAFAPQEWSTLQGTQRGDADYNPFVSHAFLGALEESGCATARTGWAGAHLRLEDADGTLIGAVPCYRKTHSQGEYVFDHGWADAFERAGGSYYPKLQVSVPFTPATGPRLLYGPTGAPEATRAYLAAALKAACDQIGTSSAHVTFAAQPDLEALTDSSSTSTMMGSAATTISSPRLPRASARP